MVWLKRIGRRMSYPIMSAAAFLPLALLCGARHAAAYAIAYLLLIPLCQSLPRRARLPAGLLSAALLAASGFALEQGGARFAGILYAVCALIALPAGSPESTYQRFVVTGFVGAAIHLATQAAQSLNAPLSSAQHALWQASFLVFAVSAVLAMNRGSLGEAGTSGQTVSAGMRARNRRATLLSLLAAVTLASLPAVSRALRCFGRWLRDGILAFIAWLNRFGGEESAAISRPASNPLMGGIEAGEASPFWAILERILIWLCAAVTAVGAAFLLYALGKKLIQLIRILLAKLRAYGAAASADYVDEVADTRTTGEIVQRITGRLRPKRRSRPIPEDGLDPRGRIRARYANPQRAHADRPEGATARENLADPAAANLYEKARYSALDVSDADAEAFVRRFPV